MSSLQRFLFSPIAKAPRSSQMFWLSLSLALALIYPILALQEAFSSEYVVQDDARQHVFWMLRFLDPALLPNDFLADYFQSVAPWGYARFYQIVAWMGISPFLLHKLLPAALILVSTIYSYGACLQLLPVPLAGFITTLLLNQSLWMRDDIISGTPVAFVYPIFSAFLYYLLNRSLLPCLITIALQGLFYPQCVFLFGGVLVLQLVRWEGNRLRLSGDRQTYWVCGAGLLVAFLVLLPYALTPSEYGPVLTKAEAKALPTLNPGGWSAFFTNNPIDFWFCGKRSGIFPSEWCEVGYEIGGLTPVPLGLPHIWFGLALPVLLRFSTRFPLAQQVTSKVAVLPQLLVSSVFWFLAAHTFLFKLHLPNRYGEHSLRIVAALAAGLAITIVLEALVQRGLQSRASSPRRSPLPLATAGLLAIALLIYPYFITFEDTPFPVIRYRTGRAPELYEFFAQQPKDSVIASLASEANSLPSFAQRSIVVGGKGFILPYHQGYYEETNQRVTALMTAQYSPDLAQVQQFIQTYDVDFWLLEDTAFQPKYFKTNQIFEEYAAITKQIRPQLRNGPTPALAQLTDTCTVFQKDQFTVMSAECIMQQGTQPGTR